MGQEMDFGDALRLLKNGGKVARRGWNGRGMWIELMEFKHAEAEIKLYDMPFCPCIMMKTAQNTIQPGWLASQADLLAEDWIVVE